jgi:predicted nucleotidyltransferase
VVVATELIGVPAETLAEIVRRLVAALAPRAIYAFGSRVYGTPHRDSDVDLMLVVEGDGSNRAELARLGYGCLPGVPLPVELHFTNAERLERFADVVGSLEREVRRRGRTVYAA